MKLVDAEALGTLETADAVSSFHAGRDREVAKTAGKAAAGVLDVTTGKVLVALSILLLVASYLTATSTGGTGYVIAFGPFIYGVIRLMRGWEAQRMSREEAKRSP